MLYVYVITESGSSITVDNNVMDVMRMVAAAMELKDSCSLEEKLWQT